MELRQLRYFVAIAAAGSLSKASERLRIAQPALSLQLANLEAYLGTKLFERYNRGVRLTQSGTMLLQHAVTILKGVSDATEMVRRPSDDIQGQVSLGLPSTVSASFVAALLARAAHELPSVRLHLSEHTTVHLGELLRDGELDLAILMNAPDQASVSTQPLLLESYCLISRAGHDVTGDTIDWQDAASLPLVLPGSGSILRLMIEEAALQAGHQLNVRAELDSARLIKAAVSAGIGHSILPRSNLLPEGETADLHVRLIVNPEIRSLLQLASSTIRLALPAQMAVRELLIRLVREFVIEQNWRAELHWSLT
jgi:LysR family nitrogen assimilation transcriptional regulator